MIVEFLSDYTLDDSLGRDLHAFVAIKGFNQQAIVRKIIERKGKKSLGLTSLDDSSRRRYSDGRILLISLDRDRLSAAVLNGNVPSIECFEPYHVATRAHQVVYTAGPQFELLDLKAGARRTVTNPWMAYLHTVDFSADGRRLLTVSTGFDTLQEIDLATGAVVWEWNAWDHGFTYSPRTKMHYVRTVSQGAAIRTAIPNARITIIDDPAQLPREGLPTQATPLNINGTFYGKNGHILATAYHRSELLVIARDGTCRRHDLGLSHPHSFRPVAFPGHEGYMVSDTGAGRILLLDDGFGVVKALDANPLPADAAKKAGFGEWFQTATVLDAERGILAVVDALRDGVHLIDVPRRRRRFIPNPPHWTIQTVAPMPPRLQSKMALLSRLADGESVDVGTSR